MQLEKEVEKVFHEIVLRKMNEANRGSVRYMFGLCHVIEYLLIELICAVVCINK